MLKHIQRIIRKFGFWGSIEECYFRVTDTCYEKYLGVNTKGVISREQMGIDHSESQNYEMISYRYTIGMFKKLPLAKDKITLLDYGCGKGRVIAAAAKFSFKRIIGIELSSLAKIAEDNISNMKHRETENILIKQCDAVSYKVPSDVNVIYFYNPFVGSVLEKVITNIHTSILKSPRKLYIIFFNNHDFDRIILSISWVRKTYQSKTNLGFCYGLYETFL